MLCFDVKIDKEAQQYAEEVGVKIFSAEIIYHLFDSFTVHQKVGLSSRSPPTSYVRLMLLGTSKCWRHNVKSRPHRQCSRAC